MLPCTSHQRRQGRGTVTCEVCKAGWSILLEALDRECFVRSVRTNSRYAPVDDTALDEAAQEALSDLMRPGSLILQTPLRAAETSQTSRAAAPR